MKGDILLDAEIVLSGVDVVVDIQTRQGLKKWRGSFSLEDPALLTPGAEYKLFLADGRTGRIIVTGKSFSPASGRTSIQFTGTGPLTKKEGADE